jgi:predicted AlkP superfamily phosphohydrolase/phosphomutase
VNRQAWVGCRGCRRVLCSWDLVSFPAKGFEKRLKTLKVAILGIDGLDPVLFRRWRAKLPHLDRLAQNGTFCELQSVIPPDSVPAWISIYTGAPPAEHGVLHSFDYLEHRNRDFRVDTGGFRGKTFWDFAGAGNRKVLILNPFLAYPAWSVRGILVSGPVFESGDLSGYPESILDEYSFPPLGGIVDFPRKDELSHFVEKTRDLTEQQARIFVQVAREKEWDLLFMTLLTFDRLAHFTWRYTDAADQTYPGENKLEHVLVQAYQQFDRVVGMLDEIVSPDAELLVISDHGHGRRCTRILNVNEYLRGKGYLASSVGKHHLFDHRYWMEVLKVKVLEFLDRHELQDLTFRIVKLVPHRKALKHSTHVTDRKGSLAVAPDFNGTNPFGGIEIHREVCEERGVDYNRLRKDLAAEMAGITDPESGEQVVRWIRPREDVYGEGEYLDRYPDLVFELDPEYGVSWNLFGDLIGANTTHRKISGGHRRNGVLFSRRRIQCDGENPPSVLQVAPTVLSLLGIPIPAHMKAPPLGS